MGEDSLGVSSFPSYKGELGVAGAGEALEGGGAGDIGGGGEVIKDQ